MFKKVTPGFACKVAEKVGARWLRIADYKEAQWSDGTCIAYADKTGYYVSTTFLDLDVSDVIA
jgi:hypothetical protein